MPDASCVSFNNLNVSIQTQQLESKQARLEKLSRALQAERNDLAQRLRQYEGNDKKSKENSRKKKVLEEQTNKEQVQEQNGKYNKFLVLDSDFFLFFNDIINQ